MGSDSQEQTGKCGEDNSLYKLFGDTLSQHYSAMSLMNLKTPEFFGKPKEDVYSFMARFKASIFGLPHEARCQALRKALQETAADWAKREIRKEIASGDWKTAKKKLIERFGEPDRTLRYRRELSKMTFKEVESTLIGYIERFVTCYKKAHPSHRDTEAIKALEFNLPSNIIGYLNMIDDKWVAYESIDRLSELVIKLENKILPYQPKQSTQTDDIAVEVEKRIQNLLTKFQQDVLKPKADAEQAEKLALIDHREKEESKDRRAHQRYGSSRQPFKRPYRNYQGNYKRTKSDDEAYKSTEDKKPLTKEELEKKYADRHGTLNGSCFLCKGPHFIRHCPYRDLN